MAQTLADSAELALFPPFARRVQAAVSIAAKDVGAEVDDPTNPSRTQLRRALATNVFANPNDYGLRFAWAVATNPVITLASTDGDIQFTVNSVWDTIAGAPPRPQ
ncbi:hypothetical protein [Amycolatopsis sp. CA-230715]|uniref:hypothetical protein n=1 Tax=Amycolatopsis sp. CA-230715 TaxID=2745196 RepID=UPI001C01F401|nr:hypothetical protein [Amycolatopsis sp. CA-230715]QWF78694.1 hypothetical protein HUW46_02092 [Amycolatopsis sp. CA-230715]